MFDISKYLNNETFLINDKNTWHQDLLDLIESNKPFIRKYKYVETYNFNLHEAAKDCTPVNYKNLHRTNLYYYDLEYIKECVKSELQKLTLIGYHATRLTNEEVANIKKDGLITSSKENCYKRADNLLFDGYITKNECNYIKRHCILNFPFESDRLGQIWFLSGNCDISTKYTGLNNLYKDYGGETIRNGIENTQLLKKLNEISKPCSVISYVKLNTIPQYQIDTLAEKLLLQSNKRNISKISFEMYSESKRISVIDIIYVNEHTRLKFIK
ncbi:MAG: hypothetical protein J1G01_00815 [Clostridiales bacterium]|nr:hypothetical protein [Clostridiales bacterium]